MATSKAILAGQHRRRVEGFLSRLEKSYARATARFISLSQSVSYDHDSIFSFSNYAQLNNAVDEVVKSLALGIRSVVLSGTSAEWAQGTQIATSTVGRVLSSIGMSKDSLSKGAESFYFDNHQSVLKAFQGRMISSGETLSKRVWDLANHHKLENELAISISKGASAAETAEQIKSLLNEPDKLFRRVRDEYGELQLSKHAAQYSPGAGIYRSSYKNAMRLARTEINMAYRNSEIAGYQDKDFVVGYEIHRSTHDYDCDVCAELAGKYPKDFEWSGWHPNCRCFITPILITEDEMKARRESILRGEEFDSSSSENAVKDVPDNFKDWAEENKDRIESSLVNGKVPYFINNNLGYIGDAIGHSEVQNAVAERLARKTQLSISDIETAIGANGEIITRDIFSKDGVYTEKRTAMQERLIDEYIAGHNAKSNTVFMLGGAPANGKSTVVDSGMLPHPKGALVVDPDKVKGMLPEYKQMVASGKALLVEKAANFVHEESSMMGKSIRKKALAQDIGTVIDGVNDGSFEKVQKNVATIRAESGGKRVRADYVTLDSDLSLKLARARAAKTGRVVPEDYIRKMNSGVAELVPKLIKDKTFDELFLWDTNINGKPRLILKQIDGKLDIVDQKLYDNFLAKSRG